MEIAMGAFVVIESVVKDEEAMRRYAAAAGPTLQSAGAEFVARGPWHVLSGDSHLTSGGIVRFANKAAALAWYRSSDYQAILEIRDQAMDARFRLIG